MSDLSVDYLVRLVQIHLDFRKAELVSLAAAEDIKIQILEYDDDVRMRSSVALHIVACYTKWTDGALRRSAPAFPYI